MALLYATLSATLWDFLSLIKYPLQSILGVSILKIFLYLACLLCQHVLCLWKNCSLPHFFGILIKKNILNFFLLVVYVVLFYFFPVISASFLAGLVLFLVLALPLTNPTWYNSIYYQQQLVRWKRKAAIIIKLTTWLVLNWQPYYKSNGNSNELLDCRILWPACLLYCWWKEKMESPVHLGESIFQ